MAHHHTTVVMNQPTPAVMGNPKLIGSVQGVRDWSSGLFSCCDDCMASKYPYENYRQTAENLALRH